MSEAAETLTMTLEDLRRTLDWAADEGWNPGLEDAEAFLAADPGGFLVRRVGETPVAAISVVNHAPDFAFLGLYLCHPDWRAQGHGLAIWQAGLAHAGTRCVGLDGVPDQQENYRKSGFEPAGTTQRLTGTPRPIPDHDFRHANPGDIEALVTQDKVLSGVDRGRFLRGWMRPGETRHTLVARAERGLRAHGTIRACREGAKIGPFLAPDAGTALALLGDLGALFPGMPVSLDVPAHADGLTELLTGRGFAPSFQTARMYRGHPPRIAKSPFEAVATLELG